jgi:hypothetical protein
MNSNYILREIFLKRRVENDSDLGFDITVNREIFASVLFSRFSRRDFHECTVKRELKTCENFNSNALTIKFLQQTRNFVYRY